MRLLCHHHSWTQSTWLHLPHCISGMRGTVQTQDGQGQESINRRKPFASTSDCMQYDPPILSFLHHVVKMKINLIYHHFFFFIPVAEVIMLVPVNGCKSKNSQLLRIFMPERLRKGKKNLLKILRIYQRREPLLVLLL